MEPLPAPAAIRRPTGRPRAPRLRGRAGVAAALLAAAAALLPAGAAAGQAVDTVTAADPPPGLRLDVGSDTLRASTTREGVRIPLGTVIETVTRTETPEGPGYLLVEKKALPSGWVVDSLTVLEGSLAPVRHVSRESSGDRAEARYAGRAVEVRTDTAGAPAGSRRRALPRAPYDVAQVRSLVRRLPLSEGYVARIAAFDPWGRDLRWVEARVTGAVTVERAGRETPAWRVRAPVAEGWSAVYLISRETREELGFEVRGRSGELLWEARPR